MTQGPFDNDNQFIVSYELLQLFKWLFENEQETLKKIINKALDKGLKDKLLKRNSTNEIDQQDLQHNIVEFFILLETLIYELLSEDQFKKGLERNLIPVIDKVDSKSYDNATFQASVAKATEAWHNNPNTNTKDVFCKELLKRWKPSKKISIN